MFSARVLDVGAGQGTQSIRLARAGHQVLAVEPDPAMRGVFAAALAAEPAEVQDHVSLRPGSVGNLRAVTGDEDYDAVLLLGVLMYLQASEPVIAELAARVAPGGILALAARIPATGPARAPDLPQDADRHGTPVTPMPGHHTRSGAGPACNVRSRLRIITRSHRTLVP